MMENNIQQKIGKEETISYSMEDLKKELEEARVYILEDYERALEERVKRGDNKELEELYRNSIEKFKVCSDERVFMRFSNNFGGHLPGGYKRSWGSAITEGSSESLKELVKKEKKLNDDVDRIIVSLGGNIEEVATWQENYRDWGPDLSELEIKENLTTKEIERINDLKKKINFVMNVFIEMRKLGYEKYPELTG